MKGFSEVKIFRPDGKGSLVLAETVPFEKLKNKIWTDQDERFEEFSSRRLSKPRNRRKRASIRKNVKKLFNEDE